MKIKTIIAILIGFSACGQIINDDEKVIPQFAAADNASYFLQDTTVKIIWSADTTNSKDTGITVNKEYLNTLSAPVQAAISFSLIEEQQNETHTYISKINSKFGLLTSLAKHSRDSDTSKELMKQWFRYDTQCLTKIETPPSCSHNDREKLCELNLTIKKDTIKVFFTAIGVNMLEAKSWKRTQEDIFLFDKNNLRLIEEKKSEL